MVRQFNGKPPRHGIETALIRRAQKGDLAALDPIVRQMTPLRWARLHQRFGSELSDFDLDDVVQQGWLTAIAKLATLQGRLGAALFRFLESASANHARNLVRWKTGRATRAGDVVASKSPGELECAVIKERHDEYCRRLSRLDEVELRILVLRVVGTPNAIVAGEFGISPQAVAKRFHRIRGRLLVMAP